MRIISDQRGIRQEVMLIMKRGIEAKSYEGVSPLYISLQMFLFLTKTNFLIFIIVPRIFERNHLTLLCLLSFYMWLVSAVQLVK